MRLVYESFEIITKLEILLGIYNNVEEYDMRVTPIARRAIC